jgi:FKBP-type peptidyl-prolyl cis-trans isomerase SlyD
MAAWIDRGTVVTLTYELRSSEGELLDEEGATAAYLHGGYGGIFPKVEEALEGKQAGHELALSLEPEDAFGDYEPELLRVEPRESFPEILQVGMRFEGVPGDAAGGEPRIYTVTDIADDKVVVDGNHPLAGERLWFRCSVTGVRPATPDEMRHGHAHGVHSEHGSHDEEEP